MTQPLPLDTVLGEFSEDSTVWTLRSERQGTYLVIPDDRFPGRPPVRFFLSREDADYVLAAVLHGIHLWWASALRRFPCRSYLHFVLSLRTAH